MGYEHQATSYRLIGGLSESSDFQLHLLHRCGFLIVFSHMWERQMSMWLTRVAAYVVGGRVGVDETHQVKIHVN